MRHIILLCCLFAPCVHGEKFDLIWEKEFETSPTLSFVPHEGVYVNSKLYLVGYAFSPQGNTRNYWLWQIDSSGNLLHDNDLLSMDSNRYSIVIGGSCQTSGLIVKEGAVYFGGLFDKDGPSVMKFGTVDGKPFQQSLKPHPHGTSEETERGHSEKILRMISLPDDHILFVGIDVDSKGYAKKTDSDGNLCWHKVYDKGTISFLPDAVVIGRYLILLECYTDSDPVKNAYEGYTCRLMQCDLEGNIRNELSFVGGGAFPNKYPELHAIDPNSFLVGYDGNLLPNQTSYSVAAFSCNLEPLWKTAISDNAVQSPVPVYTHVVPIHSGGFAVAHNEMSTDGTEMIIHVEQYTTAGKPSASLLLHNYLAINGFRLIPADKQLFVVGLSLADDAQRRVKVKIGDIATE